MLIGIDTISGSSKIIASLEPACNEIVLADNFASQYVAVFCASKLLFIISPQYSDVNCSALINGGVATVVVPRRLSGVEGYVVYRRYADGRVMLCFKHYKLMMDEEHVYWLSNRCCRIFVFRRQMVPDWKSYHIEMARGTMLLIFNDISTTVDVDDIDTQAIVHWYDGAINKLQIGSLCLSYVDGGCLISGKHGSQILSYFVAWNIIRSLYLAARE